MPLNYTRWYPRRVKYIPMSLPEQPRETLSSYSRALKFLKTEFFNFDAAAFEQFCLLYGKKNGAQLRQQAEGQYPQWKSGEVRMSAQTVKRVLECVPPCLSREKQFELLCFQIPSVIRQQKTAFKMNDMVTSQLPEAYARLAQRIKGCEFTMEWFLKDLFSAHEIEAFTSVFTYTMLDRLRQSYDQVCQDLTWVFSRLAESDCSVALQYRITLLDCTVKIDTRPDRLDTQFLMPVPEPALVTAYRPQYRKILLEHELGQRREEMEGQTNRRMALSDVTGMVDLLKRIDRHQECDTRLQIRGSGGRMALHLQKKNLQRLRSLMALQVFKLISIPGGMALSGVLMVKQAATIPLMLTVGFILAYMVSPAWEKLQEIKTEVAEYEQNRRKWLAAVRH